MLADCRLLDILLNITDNAFKFTKEGSIQLLVSVERDAETDQDYLRYLVS